MSEKIDLEDRITSVARTAFSAFAGLIMFFSPLNSDEVRVTARNNAPSLHSETLEEFVERRYEQLQNRPEDFENTERPNMLYIVPTADSNGVFENERSLRIYQNLSEIYDAYVLVASTESEVYEAISNVPDIKLFVLSGHGTPSTIQLGKTPYLDMLIEDNGGYYEFDISNLNDEEYALIDEYVIDIRDKLFEYIDMLHPNAVIFLNSCSNGYGGLSESNLANHFISQSSGRTVISATRPFSPYDVRILDLYPFDIQILAPLDRFSLFRRDINITYSNRPEDIHNRDYKLFPTPFYMINLLGEIDDSH